MPSRTAQRLQPGRRRLERGLRVPVRVRPGPRRHPSRNTVGSLRHARRRVNRLPTTPLRTHGIPSTAAPTLALRPSRPPLPAELAAGLHPAPEAAQRPDNQSESNCRPCRRAHTSPSRQPREHHEGTSCRRCYLMRDAAARSPAAQSRDHLRYFPRCAPTPWSGKAMTGPDCEASHSRQSSQVTE